MAAQPTVVPKLDLAGVDGILAVFRKPGPADILPILLAVQDSYGYLPPVVLDAVSQRTGLALAHLYSVASFYAQFSFVPRGRHVIRLCRGTACEMRRGRKVRAAVEQHLAIKDGETTPDMKFTLETIACLGACAW